MERSARRRRLAAGQAGRYARPWRMVAVVRRCRVERAGRALAGIEPERRCSGSELRTSHCAGAPTACRAVSNRVVVGQRGSQREARSGNGQRHRYRRRGPGRRLGARCLGSAARGGRQRAGPGAGQRGRSCIRQVVVVGRFGEQLLLAARGRRRTGVARRHAGRLRALAGDCTQPLRGRRHRAKRRAPGADAAGQHPRRPRGAGALARHAGTRDCRAGRRNASRLRTAGGDGVDAGRAIGAARRALDLAAASA